MNLDCINFCSARQAEVIADIYPYGTYRVRQANRDAEVKGLEPGVIAQMISYGRQPITSRRVSLVMKAIGFHSERNSKGCYYKLFEMDTNESQRVISDMLSASDQCNECSEELDLPF